MTQQKIIQAMGRIGRNKVQQEYTIRFRDDDIMMRLFQPVTHNLEAMNMSKLFAAQPRCGVVATNQTNPMRMGKGGSPCIIIPKSFLSASIAVSIGNNIAMAIAVSVWKILVPQ